MQVFQSPGVARQTLGPCVATIGKYDGMHLGHQHILDELLRQASDFALPALVILSEPQPEEFFSGASAPPRLNPFHDKVAFLEGYGIDAVYRMAFDHALSQQDAGDFVREVLATKLGIRSLVVGDDFRFGRNRGGDIALLRQLGAALDFQVSAVQPCCVEQERVSSTLVRQYLQAGNFARVKRLLGRHYSLSGTVIRGRQLGRQIGIPTANLALQMPGLPMTGVYAVTVRLPDGTFAGVANLGYKPTVSAVPSPSLEVHLLDFDRDIYGVTMQVTFVQKIRDEQKFAGLPQLQQQIRLDIAEAQRCFCQARAAEPT
jgi:riboflavin kinase/FMN adenylyltransferase